MSRWWTDLVAAVSDLIPLPLLLFLMIVLAGVTAALWYYFPAWVPRRLPRLRRPRWRGWRDWRLPRWRKPRLPRWRIRRRAADREPAALPEPVAGDLLPDLSSTALASLADRLAAEGRYAEAIRERLRAMVRHLVERGVLDDRPGWTVTELAAAATAALPTVALPLDEATTLFSDIWYGGRPAQPDADARMRVLEQSVRAAPDGQPAAGPAWAGTANGGAR